MVPARDELVGLRDRDRVGDALHHLEGGRVERALVAGHPERDARRPGNLVRSKALLADPRQDRLAANLTLVAEIATT